MLKSLVADPAEFGKVAVAMGGSSAEREISLRSGEAVLAALKRKNIDAEGVDIANDPVAAMSCKNYDRVFNSFTDGAERMVFYRGYCRPWVCPARGPELPVPRLAWTS